MLEALKKDDASLLHADTSAEIRSILQKGFFRIIEGLIYRAKGLRSAVVVIDHPTQVSLLDACHDEPLAGHFSADRTFECLRALAWWPGLRQTVDEYCRTCNLCIHAKRLTGKPFGLLQRIGQSAIPWEQINIDFAVELPPAGAESYNAIMVVTDRCSRHVRLVPCHTTDTATETAMLFLRHIVSQHGYPKVIISDRDPRFISDFWKAFHELLGTRLAMSTANHPQTD